MIWLEFMRERGLERVFQNREEKNRYKVEKDMRVQKSSLC